MKKKKGFTLLELIIVMALVLIALSITFTMFNNMNKTNVDINIKDTLQTEAQDISQKISNSGMESSGITKVTLENGTALKIGDVVDEEKYSTLAFVDSSNKIDSSNPQNYYKNNQWISVQKIEINNKYEGVNEEIKDTPLTISYDNSKRTLSITKQTFDVTKTPIGFSTSDISVHVDSILIKPSNAFKIDDLGKVNIENDGKISNATSIDININLSKKVGLINIKYSVPVTITFRNKAIS